MEIKTSRIIIKIAKKKAIYTISARVWNRLLDIAEKRNIKVHLGNLEELNGFYLSRDPILETPSCIMLAFKINTSRVKGSYSKKRNIVFAHELAHDQLGKREIGGYSILSPSYQNDKKYQAKAIEHENTADKLGERLVRFLERSESLK